MGKGAFAWSFLSLFVIRNISVQAQMASSMASLIAPNYSVAFVTVSTNEEAKKIARGLVKEKLAACVNIIPQIVSIYEWKDEITEDNEFLMMIKTRTDAVDDLTTYVKKHHSYTVCEVISLKIDNGNEDYLKWIGNIVPSKLSGRTK